MKICNKIYTKRELRRRPQEDMVTRLSMSTDGYAKLEYGETRLNISRLEQIASVFNIGLNELMAINERSIICLISEKSQHSRNDYATSQQALTAKINRLQQQLQHQEVLGAQKDAFIVQQAREIETLRTLVAVSQKNGGV
nr:helix-turn-helix transcriptional regulator [uncultured Cardiobacterium sp.]